MSVEHERVKQLTIDKGESHSDPEVIQDIV